MHRFWSAFTRFIPYVKLNFIYKTLVSIICGKTFSSIVLITVKEADVPLPLGWILIGHGTWGVSVIEYCAEARSCHAQDIHSSSVFRRSTVTYRDSLVGRSHRVLVTRQNPPRCSYLFRLHSPSGVFCLCSWPREYYAILLPNMPKVAKRSACDQCRAKRVRCLLPEGSTEPCARCITYASSGRALMIGWRVIDCADGRGKLRAQVKRSNQERYPSMGGQNLITAGFLDIVVGS